MEKFRFSVSREPFDLAYHIRTGRFIGDKIDSIIAPMTLQKIEEGFMSAPSISLSYDEAQELMNKLWESGLRPAEIANQERNLPATKYHLEDMRKIVFEYLFKNDKRKA